MNYRNTLTALSIAAALVVAVAPAATAAPVGFEHGPNLVTNGGFETGDFSGWVADVSIFSGVDGPAAHSGNFGAYSGDGDPPGTIRQDIETVPAAHYNIHFWLRSDGQTPNQFYVEWGGATVFDASDLGAFEYTEFVVDPIGAGFTTELVLGFRNDFGFLEFDDVSVFAVPEPISFALLGVGLVGLGWARRKAA